MKIILTIVSIVCIRQMSNEEFVYYFSTTFELWSRNLILLGWFVWQATSQLVISLRNQAELQSDPDQQNKLLAAAKSLAEATAHMVEAAKVYDETFIYLSSWMSTILSYTEDFLFLNISQTPAIIRYCW